MNQKFLIAAVFLAILCSFLALGQGVMAAVQREGVQSVPEMVSYQGRVTLNGLPYNGQGYFKFAVVDASGTISYWSNDSTSSGGGEPTNAVQLTATDGLFSVLLGQPPMPPLSVGVFAGPERALRVWFSANGTNFTRLEPDRAIASVPYALQAEEAGNADLLDGQDSTFYQKRVNGVCADGSALKAVNSDGSVACQGVVSQVQAACAPGYAIQAINADGSVTCAAVGPRPGFSRSILDPEIGEPGTYTVLSMAMGVDSLPWIVYEEYNYDAHIFRSKLAHCLDLACTRADIQVLDPELKHGFDYAISIGVDSLPVIVYDDYQRGGLFVAHCEDLNCGTIARRALMVDGFNMALAIGVDGYPIIVFDDGEKLSALHCEDLSCATFTTHLIQDDDSFHNPSIVIGADGLPVVSYYALTGDQVRVAHCDDLVCGSSTITVVESGLTYYGVTTSISVAGDGMPIFSYYDSTNYALKIAHCENMACTGVTTSVLDAPGSIGDSHSLAVAPDGHAVISYKDYSFSPDASMKVAFCVDYACSSAVTTVVETGPGIAYYNAVMIGADGLPLLSYYDNANRDFVVTHCSNMFCTPATRRR